MIRTLVDAIIVLLSAAIIVDYVRVASWLIPLYRTANGSSRALLGALLTFVAAFMADAALWIFILAPTLIEGDQGGDITPLYVVTIVLFLTPRLAVWAGMRAARHALDRRQANGVRRMVSASGVVAAFLVALAGWYTRPVPVMGEYPVPQTVTTRVGGIDGPAVRAGGAIEVSGTKCIASPEPVETTGESWWVRQDVAGSDEHIIPHISGSRVRQPGCKTQTFVNPLPPGVTEGRWRLEGTEWATREGRRDERAWYTETFEVIPHEGE